MSEYHDDNEIEMLKRQLEQERQLRKYDQEKAEGDRARAEHRARADKDYFTTGIALVSLALFCAIVVIFNLQ
jgi:polynucleotide 5'-kinase involved in rRNA processing